MTVVFLKGTHDIRETLSTEASIVIRGEGEKEDTVLHQNDAWQPANVVLINNAEGATIRDLTLEGGAKGPNGNFLHFGTRGGRIENCIVRNVKRYNQANGGGIYAENAKAVVSHCIITNCYGYWNGAIYNASADNTFVRDCNGVYFNYAVYQNLSGTYTNCTFIAPKKGFSLQCYNGNAPTFCNCILTATTDYLINIACNSPVPANTTNRSFNCVLAGKVYVSGSKATLSSGGYGTDCQFLSAEEIGFRNAERGNYRLKASSPCVNAGVTEGWMKEAVDLDGKPRVFNLRADIGCYENQSGGLMLLVR